MQHAENFTKPLEKKFHNVIILKLLLVNKKTKSKIKGKKTTWWMYVSIQFCRLDPSEEDLL